VGGMLECCFVVCLLFVCCFCCGGGCGCSFCCDGMVMVVLVGGDDDVY